jgi:hypothetical protein
VRQRYSVIVLGIQHQDGQMEFDTGEPGTAAGAP